MKPAITPLAAHHDRTDFDCGEAPLNEFLRRFARQQADRDFSRTYVAAEGESPRILGFYALSGGAVDFKNLPPTLRLPRYPVPVARLARLAVDRRQQGRGLGGLLLRHALRLSASLAEQIGLHAVVVDAKQAEAAAFYAHFGFQPFQEGDLRLFLPMAVIRQADFTEQSYPCPLPNLKS
jgi:GNAT superfamily N-acetyltransferase